jgi:hypothetical protein
MKVRFWTNRSRTMTEMFWTTSSRTFKNMIGIILWWKDWTTETNLLKKK